MIAGQTFVPLQHLGDVGQTTESPTHSLISPFSAARGGVSRCVFFSETFFTPHSSAATNLRSSTLMLRLTLESLSPSAYSSSGEEGAYLYSLNPDGLRIESIPFSRFRREASWRGEARRDCGARLRQRAAALPLTPDRSLRRPSSLLPSPPLSSARASGISLRSGDLPFHLLGN